MKKYINKIKLRIERSLISKIMVLKQEVKYLKKINDGLKEENHKLIDEHTIMQMKIRELDLGIRKENKNG